MAALVVMGAILAGCAKEQVVAEESPVLCTTTISMGTDGTKALTAAGVKTFAEGEKMAVIYKNSSGETVKAESEALLDNGDITNNGKSATFTFALLAPDKTQDVTYIYPAAMAKADGEVNYDALAIQDGTLASLAANLDYCTKSGAWNADALPSLTLENQLAICAYTLKNSDNTSDITHSITNMSISDGTYSYFVSRSPAAGPIYVAIRPTTSASFEITASCGLSSYKKSLTDKTYLRGNGYNIGLMMQDDEIVSTSTPMTFKALTAGTIVVSNPKSGMKYSVNGGEKMTDGIASISVSAGDKVAFYGNETSVTGYSSTRFSGGTATCIVYGNIMSLVNETEYATATTLSGLMFFSDLFNGNTTLTDAGGLLLPATTLCRYCYRNMFNGCTALTSAPAALPASTMTEQCYNAMFNGCTSLVTAPEILAINTDKSCCIDMFNGCTALTEGPSVLSAEIMSDYCYRRMFYGCTSLTTAPDILATTAARGSCLEMFYGCSSLTVASDLIVSTVAKECFYSMFQGCTNLSTAPATLPAMTLEQKCYTSMFEDCASLTTAPELPAQTLADYCYNRMFYGCINLNSVTCLATDISASYATTNWLSFASSTGTFTAANSEVAWSSGTSGIPGDWTRVNKN